SGCVLVQAVGFFVAGSGIGLLHHVSRLLQIVGFLSFELLDLLADVIQVLWLAIVAFIAMAADASTLAIKIFAFADRPADVSADQNHVSGVASLASGFDILFGKQWPEPVFVVAVRFLDAGGGPPIALMTRRTSEFVGIVRLQQLRLGVT